MMMLDYFITTNLIAYARDCKFGYFSSTFENLIVLTTPTPVDVGEAIEFKYLSSCKSRYCTEECVIRHSEEKKNKLYILIGGKYPGTLIQLSTTQIVN